MKAAVAFNPFPGLRPFEPDEDHLFFGREKQIDELLRRLRETQFLAVVGASGSGKSSLVRSGLVPALHSGLMATAGSSWRVAMMRPGEDPIENLAACLNPPDVLGTSAELAETNRVVLEATLRRSTLGLVEAVRQARLPADENVLVMVDQFEELFRFRRTPRRSKDEAVLFVKLLLEAVAQPMPIYVVLTMRSDFIGEFLEYPGLPEAVNKGQYLVPRMTRDELRAAISGPVAVAGGTISPRLVLRLINHVGDDPDQLPVLQHALMRTWDYWQRNHRPGEPLDITHYEAIGGMRNALSLHADEAFEEIGTERAEDIAEKLFRALTDTSTDSRGVRRPTSVKELTEVCGASESEVISIVELFRRPGRSFLMPPAGVPLDSDSIIDISHESLMRCWTRLIAWTGKERMSAAAYERVAEAAAWYEQQTAGLWRDPELELALEWRRNNQPTAAWAQRYNPFFERAMKFLDLSEEERNRLRGEQERERRRKLRRAWSFSAALGLLLVAAVFAALIAQRENARAEANLETAKKAVDEMLSSAGSQSARVAVDSPQTEQFRRELLEKARTFYSELALQEPNNEALRKEVALAHFRLGDIERLLQQSAAAIAEYEKAIVQLEALVKEFPRQPEYRQLLANANNWLGETERPLMSYRTEAQEAYDAALRLQNALTQEMPDNQIYRQELARTHYNRGILLSDNGQLDDADYREAIRLLEPLAGSQTASPQVRQELARAYNNLGRLLRRLGKTSESQDFYGRAIAIHESLAQSAPENREYKLELAAFYNNLAILFQERDQLEPASQRNRQAIELFEDLAKPLPSLGIELAHAHDIRGRILESQSRRGDAEREYERSISIFESLRTLTNSSEYHLTYGQALFNLAALHQQDRKLASAARLVAQASIEHSAAGSQVDLAYDYLLLTRIYIELGSRNEARSSAAKLSELMPELPDSDRSILTKALEGLRVRLEPTDRQ